MAGTTDNRGYPFPTSGDAPRVYADVEALAEAIDTDVQLVADKSFSPVHDTSIGSAASGFTNAGSEVYTLLFGHLIFMRILLTNTSDITPTAGTDNIADTVVFTVDSAYRPAAPTNAVQSNGVTVGEALLGSDGTVALRTAGHTIASGSNIRMTFMFIQP